MTITIGSFSAQFLTAQPYGHDESTVYQGRSARKWAIQGLFSTSEWAALNSQYQVWRDLRIQDPDTVVSGTVGTTIPFTGQGFGQSWANIDCWFLSAPSGTQVGGYVEGRVEIVDANEKLEVLLAEKESSEEEDLPNLGTINIGGTILTLLSPPESLSDLPTLETMASGGDYVSGPLKPRVIKTVEAYGTGADWDAIFDWCQSTLISTPEKGSWFPVSPPSATARHKIVNGVKIVRYTISLTIAKVK